MKLVKVRLDEVSELEPQVLASLGNLEEGLQPLSHQLGIGGAGRPDILAVDADGTLVVIEIKADTAGSSAVDQAIRYFEWAQANLALLSKPFPQIQHDRRPRILVVAPSFDAAVTRLVRYLDLDISLAQVTSVREVETGDVAVLLDSVEIPRVESPPMLRGLSEIVTYITDEMIRKEFERVLDEMRANGLTIEPWKGGKDRWLIAKYKTEGVASIQPCRSYFNYVLCDDDGTEVWPPVKLRTYIDWEQRARPDFLKWLAAAKNEA